MKKSSSHKQKSYTGGLTVAKYAAAKQLPIEFLSRLGLRDISLGKTPAIRMPYHDEEGEELAVRFRLSMKSDPRFKWRSGSKLHPYGLLQLEGARKAGHITLVEGESDFQTLWFHRIPALGLPGASSWKPDWERYLDGVKTIYALIEPDKGGEDVLKWLATSAIRDRTQLIRLNGAKDPSALYLKNPSHFPSAWKKAVAASRPWTEIENAKKREERKKFWKECRDIAKAPDILDRFAEALVQRGAAGVSRKAKTLYLALTSRLLDRIVSVGMKGASAAGKSYLVERVLDFFPPSSCYVLTAMSDKALAYSEEPLSHRFVILYEAAALGSDWAAYFVRSLMSEGRLIYELVEKTPKGLQVRRIEREGPTGLITTTTAVQLNHENETRFFSLHMNDSQKQTKKIMLSEAEKVSGKSEQPVIDDEAFFRPWRALQSWLAVAEHRVIIPFAPAIAELSPPVAVRLRRDFSAVLSLIQAHALLHQVSRQRDERGRIIATLEDYQHVRELMRDVMAEATEQSVPKNLRETVNAVEKILTAKEGDDVPAEKVAASVQEVADRLGLDRSAASRRIRDCLDRAFLETTEPVKKGRQMRLILGESLPENRRQLPSESDIRRSLAANIGKQSRE